MLIALDGLNAPIALRDCDEIIPPLSHVLGSWPFRVIESPPAEAPAQISIRRGSNSYRIASPWLSEPVIEKSIVGAVFSLTAEIACAFADSQAGLLCLHCAAVVADGRLILFPNSENAGKSTLAAGLTAQGLRLFADDVVAISETHQHGIALGLAPRLRLPLPPSCGPSLRSFIAAHQGPHDDEFMYLDLNATQLAQHGETCPIGATVLLDRRRSGPPALTSLEKGPALRQLIVQNFAPHGTSLGTIDRLFSIIEAGACLSFTYSDLDHAVGFLAHQFSPANPDWPHGPGGEIQRTRLGEIAVEVAQDGRPGSALFSQVPGVGLRVIDADLFLVKPDDGAVFHLNAVAASLWHLLALPTTLATATEAVRNAFPAVDPGIISRDVSTVFDALQDAGLIRSGDIDSAA